MFFGDLLIKIIARWRGKNQTPLLCLPNVSLVGRGGMSAAHKLNLVCGDNKGDRGTELPLHAYRHIPAVASVLSTTIGKAGFQNVMAITPVHQS